MFREAFGEEHPDGDAVARGRIVVAGRVAHQEHAVLRDRYGRVDETARRRAVPRPVPRRGGQAHFDALRPRSCAQSSAAATGGSGSTRAAGRDRPAPRTTRGRRARVTVMRVQVARLDAPVARKSVSQTGPRRDPEAHPRHESASADHRRRSTTRARISSDVVITPVSLAGIADEPCHPFALANGGGGSAAHRVDEDGIEAWCGAPRARLRVRRAGGAGNGMFTRGPARWWR